MISRMSFDDRFHTGKRYSGLPLPVLTTKIVIEANVDMKSCHISLLKMLPGWATPGSQDDVCRQGECRRKICNRDSEHCHR